MQVFHLRVLFPAMTADLAAWIPFVNLNEILSSIIQFVFQHFEKQAVTIVHSRFSVSETLIRYGFHVQVFHTDNVIPVGSLLLYLCLYFF